MIDKLFLKIRTTLSVIKLIKNWPFYFLDYFGLLNKTSLIYYLRNNIKLKIRPLTGDRATINEIFVHKNYNPQGFEIKEGDVVVDIGAHVGIFSIFTSLINKKGKIYSFEPSPDNFKILQENISFNKIMNVYTQELAISNKSGKKKFFLSKNTLSHSFYVDNPKDFIFVRAISLDRVIKQNKLKKIDFLKMDCEGAEYEILLTLPKRVISNISKISMEYHDLDEKNNHRALSIFLQKNGFQVSTKKDSFKQGMLYAKRT